MDRSVRTLCGLMAVLFLLVSASTVAAQKTWDGSEGTSWNDADNWNPSGVPTSTDDVTIANVTNMPSTYVSDPECDDLTIDSGGDFRELTEIKLAAGTTALFMVGGGVPKNFAQDTVVCAEILGHDDVEMHKYAVQITVADVRDGACSSSTLKEAASWGKVDTVHEQMVFAEATSVAPLIVSDAYHRGGWKKREPRRWAKLFENA